MFPIPISTIQNLKMGTRYFTSSFILLLCTLIALCFVMFYESKDKLTAQDVPVVKLAQKQSSVKIYIYDIPYESILNETAALSMRYNLEHGCTDKEKGDHEFPHQYLILKGFPNLP